MEDPAPRDNDRPAAGTDQPAAGSPAAELQNELAAVKERLLRALAEQQNIWRRAQREAQDALKYATAALARDLLPMADNLRRAIESAPPQKLDNDVVRQWLAGVTATERELLDAFSRHGIRRINPIGEMFDPNLHQAVFEAPDADQPAGTIVQVMQPGYILHDRLLRPAMVGVSRGHASESSDQDQRTPSTAGAC